MTTPVALLKKLRARKLGQWAAAYLAGAWVTLPLLEGSVRRDGDRLRTTAQLVDARNDRHLWSESYDRGLSDVFAESMRQAVAHAQEWRFDRAERSATTPLIPLMRC